MSETEKKKSCCPLGRRPDIAGINAALRNGMKVREVAKLYGVGKSSVGEHRKTCLRIEDPPKPPKAATEPEPVEPCKPSPPAPVAAAAEAPPLDKDADKVPDSGQGSEVVRSVPEAPRARLVPHAKDAKTFIEQSLVCADMIAAGTWEGRASVRWLSALWGLSAEAVRERHRAGAVAAEADRGHIEAERQTAIGALQEQERMALEAYAESKTAVDEEGNPVGGDAKLLAVAVKARTEMARIAGCVPQAGTTVNVNLASSPQFMEAARRYVETVEGVFDAAQAIAARLPQAPPDLVAAVLDAAADLLSERLAAKTAPALPAHEAA